jgi:cysteine synthase A
VIHRVIPVSAPDAMLWARQLARQEGILVGTSAGATFAAAIEVGKDAPKGSTILCMLPDTGERYLTTPLFADIGVEMTEDELAILRSTPTFADGGVAAPAGATAAAATTAATAPR